MAKAGMGLWFLNGKSKRLPHGAPGGRQKKPRYHDSPAGCCHGGCLDGCFRLPCVPGVRTASKTWLPDSDGFLGRIPVLGLSFSFPIGRPRSRLEFFLADAGIYTSTMTEKPVIPAIKLEFS